VPLLQERFMAESLTLSLSDRIAEYTPQGVANAYNFGLEWAPDDLVRSGYKSPIDGVHAVEIDGLVHRPTRDRVRIARHMSPHVINMPHPNIATALVRQTHAALCVDGRSPTASREHSAGGRQAQCPKERAPVQHAPIQRQPRGQIALGSGLPRAHVSSSFTGGSAERGYQLA
jgi:hypothetical protein